MSPNSGEPLTTKHDKIFGSSSSGHGRYGQPYYSAVVVNELSFELNGHSVSYRFHVDHETGDLVSDHFGGSVTENPAVQLAHNGGWSTKGHVRREFPDLGRGDFRSPAVHIKHSNGHTVSSFKYQSHTVIDGKPNLPGLPATFGSEDEVATLVLHMYDGYSSIAADISYSIFPKHDAIIRSVKISNKGTRKISIEKLASFSVDLPRNDYDMLQLRGEWARECSRLRRKIDYGTQGTAGYSSHFHNPFLAILSPTTTESQGEIWGFSLVYTGSFNVEVEKSPQGLTRTLIGMHPYQLSWPLEPGEFLVSPECVSIFSDSGVGEMSRKFHRLYRQNLIKSRFVSEPRPVLLNSWEGLYFNFDEKTIHKLAVESAALGAKLFVLDDGWFGVEHPRLDDTAGLGDWEANPDRFPKGLKQLAEKITSLQARNSQEKLQFGLWFEPEMVNRKSILYERNPTWVLHAGDCPRTELRQQLVLNLALAEVQDFIIESLTRILRAMPITYIKWDNNRGMHESPTPANHHAYMLGMYRVFDKLTSLFPNVLWEGCASGGGRFDPGILQFFPQVWTSDNTDALDRICIQFGTSLVYPPSTMGAHVSAVPNELTGRITPIRFRAHVAMMAGSFGLELDPDTIPDQDKDQIPGLIALAEKINPIVVQGDLWRLNLPEESNYPSALFISQDANHAVLFAFQIRATTVHNYPLIRLQGLDPAAFYSLDGKQVLSGATLMNGGIQYRFAGDYDSTVVLLERLQD
ncbi:alpha-galactosidase C precursor [Purpureocillium lavendulum]|uniref:Alpha-galactosidase n=1 Tax=Purpureocillium lavendulum TaxID=1247861 RepID=A0AB34FD91_9HYPO|nr:alpha-galactosidase C precursor [Purpureocillium lavendulum]